MASFLAGFRSLGQCSWLDGFVGGGFLSWPFGSRSTVVAETASPGGGLVYSTTLAIGGFLSFLARDFFVIF
jgi:hypothetical protein